MELIIATKMQAGCPLGMDPDEGECHLLNRFQW